MSRFPSEFMKTNKMNEFMKKYGFWIGLILVAIVLGLVLF